MEHQSETADKSAPKPSARNHTWYESINTTACIITVVVCIFFVVLAIFILVAIWPQLSQGFLFSLVFFMLSAAGTSIVSWLITAAYYKRDREKELHKYVSMAENHLYAVANQANDIREKAQKEIDDLRKDDSQPNKDRIIGALQNVASMTSSIARHIDVDRGNWRGILAAEYEPYRQQLSREHRESEKRMNSLIRTLAALSQRLDTLNEQKDADQKEKAELNQQISRLTALVKDIHSEQRITFSSIPISTKSSEDFLRGLPSAAATPALHDFGFAADLEPVSEEELDRAKETLRKMIGRPTLHEEIDRAAREILRGSPDKVDNNIE
jgi:hypothetical protein